MSNENHYVYLLQTREFKNSNQDIYKIGRTKKENLKRFEQYPKGSILLLQMKCIDCKYIEKIILKLFREQFEQKKDIGNEYFQGNFKSMMDIIYNIVKNESDKDSHHQLEYESDKDSSDPPQDESDKDSQHQLEYESDKDTPYESENHSNDESDEKENKIYEITTYEEWSKSNNIQIIITDNKKDVGYFRFEDQLWRMLYDEKSFDFDKDNMEHLLEVIQSNHRDSIKNISSNEYISIKEFYNLDKTLRDQYQINNQYNDDKIYKDVIKKGYIKDYEFYHLKYNEYVFPVLNTVLSVKYVIFDSLNFTFTNVNNIINNKILTNNYSGNRNMLVKNTINHTIVDDILNSLIGVQIKIEYKKLLYNCIVKQDNEIIFYDCYDCLLTTWLNDLLYSISKNGCAYSDNYYDNKTEFIENLKKNNYRCIVIKYCKHKSTETQIKKFRKLGFKNIIIHKNNINIYNISKYKKYLHENKDILSTCIKEENNYEINWDIDLQYDMIFYSQYLLLTNFLKWSTIK
jgi:hypothetical protein